MSRIHDNLPESPRASLRHWAGAVVLSCLAGAGLLSCKRPCLDMCQQYELYLEECGYGWSTWFEQEGWATLDDCYDAHWEPSEGEVQYCQSQQTQYSTKECY